MSTNNGEFHQEQNVSQTPQLVHDHVIEVLATQLEEAEDIEVLTNGATAKAYGIQSDDGAEIYPDILCVQDENVIVICEVETEATVGLESVSKWKEYSSIEGADFLLCVPEASLAEAQELAESHDVNCQEILVFRSNAE